jgi:hypothetical protein
MEPLLERMSALENALKETNRTNRRLEQDIRELRGQQRHGGRRLRLCAGAAAFFALLFVLSLPLTPAAAALTLDQRVAALESKLVYLTRTGTDMVISGANLYIVNGTGKTITANGLGNLILGYNEKRNDGTDLRTGSHRLVIGRFNNYTHWGGMVVGEKNEVQYDYSSVTGGRENQALAQYATITGGWKGIVYGEFGAISGGRENIAYGPSSSITAGYLNQANEAYASVTGGQHNSAQWLYSAVSGGNNNVASGDSASVSGGIYNVAGGVNSSISGGGYNTTGGGGASTANGSGASVSGGIYNTANGLYASVTGGSSNHAVSSVASVSGGSGNQAIGSYSSVSGGSGVTEAQNDGWAAGSLHSP